VQYKIARISESPGNAGCHSALYTQDMDTRRDLAYLLAGAVFGAVIAVIVQEIQTHTPSILILVASLVILGWLTLLSIRTIGPLHLVLANPSGFSLDGEWTGGFRYMKGDSEVVINESLTLRQRGRYIQGRSRSTSLVGNFPLSSTAYSFTASLRPEGILDGIWHNTVEGQRFHGSFQAKVRRDGRAIIGTWMGVDESGIHRGEFEWNRG